MWQSPNQQRRALVSARKREKTRHQKGLKLRRAFAEMKTLTGPDSIHEVRVILNDFSPTSIGLFSERGLDLGQEVALTLSEPTRVYLKARVTKCADMNTESHVIREKSFGVRLVLTFIFESDEERKAIERYSREIGE